MKSKFIKYGIRVIALLIIGLLVLEVSGRIYAMIKLGTDYFTFGTKLNTSKLDDSPQHLSEVENLSTYSKYKPHSKKKDTDASNRLFEFTINNIGFRGPDVSVQKVGHTYRVICLGGSSTFGYGNRDNETYPYFLDSLLNAHPLPANNGCRRFEVINLGMPFQTSDRIYSIFLNEALPLKPDAITFYEGYNDASLIIAPSSASDIPPPTWFDNLLHDLGKRIIFVKFLNDWLLRNSWKLDQKEFETFKKGRSDFFIQNINKISLKCRELGIPVIFITQQSQSWSLSRKQLRKTTYQQEANIIGDKLAKGNIKYREACFLAHHELMNHLRSWADTSEVPLAEGIYAMDTIRYEIKNFVHLKSRANLVLAKTIQSSIMELADSLQNETAGVSFGSFPL